MRCGDYNGSAPRQPKPRSATIHSGRDARWGVWGAISGPPTFSATTDTEERHDSLGARRALGGGGGHFGAPHVEGETGGRGARRSTRGPTRVERRGAPVP